MRVLIAGGGTGGHLMPALALADALRAAAPDVEPVLVGAQRGIEATLLPDRRPSYRYHLLPAEPIYRRQWWRNARWIPLMPRLWRSCRRTISEEQPAVVIGTGGYASGPLLAVASVGGIPIVLQEQNACPGITTRWLARRATQIHLGFPEAADRLPATRATIHTHGNPVAPPMSDPTDERLALQEGSPVVFIMGGSQGALAINEAAASAMDAGLLDDWAVLWSTGQGTYDRFRRFHDPPRCHVRPFWDPVRVAYGGADIVIGRAGAMTIAELAVWGLPAVLVPLPTAAADHQTANAVALEAAGCAVHLPQRNLSGSSLAGVLADLTQDRRLHGMAMAMKARGKPEASGRIAASILHLIK